MGVKSDLTTRSPLRHWDCRWKLVSLTLLIFTITSTTGMFPLALGFFSAVFLLPLCALSPKALWLTMKAPVLLLILMLPFILLTPGSSPLVTIGPISLDQKGVHLALMISGKTLAASALLILLVQSSGFPQVMKAMGALGMPAKAVALLSTTYRFIFHYREKLKELSTAARLRGSTNRRRGAHIISTSNMLLTMLILSHDQSLEVDRAMALRGGRGSYPEKHEFKTRLRDILLSALFLIPVAAIILLEILC